MPPKGRGRGGGGGRGRGGRGGSKATAASDPQLDAADAPEVPSASNDRSSLQKQETESQSTLAGSPAHDQSAITTPQGIQNDAMDLDPNSSPATQPTETPAPTPIRAPPQAAILPPASTSTTGKKPAGKVSKFKPKNIRTNKADLDELHKKEQEKLNASNASNPRASARGNMMRGRGRGDAMGRGRMMASGAASGPFGMLPESERKHGFPGHASRREGGTTSTRIGGTGTRKSASGIKKEGTIMGGSGMNIEQDPNEPIYPDEDGAERINIEHINLISEDEDEDEDPVVIGGRDRKGKGKVRPSKGGLKPVRIDRHEHKDRVSQVNTETTTKIEPNEEGTDSDTVMIDEGKSAKPSKGGQEDGVRVKQEPNESTEMPELGPRSPKNQRTTADITGDKPEPSSPPPSRKVKPRRNSKKDKKPVIQTDEDKAEYDRHVEDVAILAEELGGMQTATQSQGRDAQGDIVMNAEASTQNPKDGRLYLFQFPPVLPKLYDPKTQEKPLPPKPVEVKKEGDGDVLITGSKNKTAIDLTKDKKKSVKLEPVEVVVKKEDAEVKEPKKVREKYVDREGWIGKLVVRESGRVELLWGGTRMLVGRGIPASFLSVGVVVDHPEARKSAEEKQNEAQGIAKAKEEDANDPYGGLGGQPVVEGHATGMGPIMGKFVVTPDWESMM